MTFWANPCGPCSDLTEDRVKRMVHNTFKTTAGKMLTTQIGKLVCVCVCVCVA